MVGFTNYMKSKASDFKIHTVGSKRDHDGKSEDSTLVHKALVSYYNERNLQTPDWLQHRKSYNNHSRESSISTGNGFFNGVGNRPSVNNPQPIPQPQVQQTQRIKPKEIPLHHQNHIPDGYKHNSFQSMGDIRQGRASGGDNGDVVVDRTHVSASTRSNIGNFGGITRANTTTGVPLNSGEVSRSSTKSRRRFG